MVSVWLNGFQAILNWANQILDDILDEDAYITPREGVYIIGFSQFIASVISLWAVTKLDRKTLLLFGHLGSAVLLFTLGVCLTTNNKQYILWVVSAYAFVFKRIAQGDVVKFQHTQSFLSAWCWLCRWHSRGSRKN